MRRPVRRELWAYLELAGVTTLAVAQPVLDTFQNGAEVFVLRRASAADVVLFTLAVVFVPPLVLLAAEALVGAVRPSLRRPTHAALVGLGALLVVWQVLVGSVDPPFVVVVLVSGAVGVAATALYLGAHPARQFVRLLGLAPFVFAALFLTTSPVRDIAFAGASSTASASGIDDPAPVVMLVFDELPTASLLDDEGRVDEARFPNFARLAGTSTWYRNHTGVSPTTPQAVPPFLTGRYPRDMDALPVTAAHPDNLFTLLDDSYELNVWEQATQLCPPDTCPPVGGDDATGVVPLLGDALDVWQDRLAGTPTVDEQQPFKVRQSDPGAPDRVDRFAETLGGDDGLRLDYLHALMPHQPWRYLPSAHRYNGPFIAEGLDGRYRWRTQDLADAARQRHLLQLQLTDEALGTVLDRLDAEERFDDALVVVTADHGAAFTEGLPIRGLADGNEAEIMWTPLFVKAPEQTDGVVDDQPMAAVDVLPTMADLLGLELPWKVDGRAAGEPRPGPDERRYYRWEGFSDVVLEDGEDYSLVDGARGFAELLALPAVPAADDGELQHHQLGRWGALVGVPVDDLEVGEPAPVTAALDDPDSTIDGVELDWDDVDLDAEVLPAYVSGTVDRGEPIDVVVAVNGVVGGWGATFAGRGDGADTRSWFATVPEALLRDGRNRIEVYVASGTQDRPVLRPIIAP